ncbi:hypothetical protein JHD47_00670 [Sulfurimonas sp. SAG-AH-194-L11]|nr:hypothetical protein [Sulfurimonas sp. SAG-AH-194-L11]MDF1876327.1 hypothetical protein [Sulfurimonas sp. SAG-AH-194-L11]
MSTNKTNVTNQVGNMDQIRELMFGPQVRMFEDEISKVNTTLHEMNNNITEKINQLDAKLTAQHKDTTAVLEQKLKSLNNSMQENNIDFKDQLLKAEKKSNQSLDDLQELFETQLNILTNEHTQAKVAIHNDLDALKSSISTLLNEEIENMQKAKVSKDDLSAMLLDLAMQVNGTSLEGNIEGMLQEQKENN